MNVWKHRQDVGLFVLAALAVASALSAIVLAFQDKAASGALCAGLSLLLLAFVQLSRFKRFKGMGFEAELWETKQEEAALLVDQTRELLSVLAKTTLTTAPRLNRWGLPFTRRELLDLSDKVATLLASAKAPTAGLRDEVDRLIGVDLAIPISNKIRAAINVQAEARSKAIKEEFGSPIRDSDGYNAAHKSLNAIRRQAFHATELSDNFLEWPALIRERLDSLLGFDEDQKAALKSTVNDQLLDLDGWVASRAIRRPEVFFSERFPEDE